MGEQVPLSTGDPIFVPMAPSEDRDELDDRSLDLLRTESKLLCIPGGTIGRGGVLECRAGSVDKMPAE